MSKADSTIARERVVSSVLSPELPIALKTRFPELSAQPWSLISFKWEALSFARHPVLTASCPPPCDELPAEH